MVVGRVFVPIPDFQTVMLPLLVQLSDEKEHSNQETLKSLAEHLHLSDKKQAEERLNRQLSLFTLRKDHGEKLGA